MGRRLVEHRPWQVREGPAVNSRSPVVEPVASRPAGGQRALDAAMVRLRTHTGEVVGSGFLVEAGHIVTCAHVVARALGRKTREAPAETDTVSLDFPLVAAGVMVHARVEAWHPVHDDDRGDIAVLALVGDSPAGTLPASLVAAEDFWSHPFRTFGFPCRYDHGVWASGVLRARQAAGWVQMEGSPSGYTVEAGFSGAAVWDDELAGVVGMTVAADARGDLRAAYLIPTEELIRAWPSLTGRTVLPCPYRGLYPFRERDVSVFYGRQELTGRLVTEVERRPLVAVVGPSGSGKSSVVFAGLLPQMVQQEGWLSISMRPAHTSSPLVALAAALLPFLEPDQAETERLTALGQLTTLLRDGHLPDVINRVLARAAKTDVLLIVDQFEELFAREGDDASEFIGLLLPVLQARRDVPPRGLTVVVTLRADFLGQALEVPVLAAALEGAVTTIGQMGRDQLRAVIEGPLPKGVTYEAGLVERILGDVGEEPGSLPLLEFALTLLWERQDRGKLTHAAYEQLGGVSGALASYAERVYVDQLLPEDQEEARRLLIQLVRPSEVGQPVRRVARRPELGEPRWQLGQRLAATRLLVADRDPTGVESVELVHEALIGGWSRLSEWCDADRAFRTWQERLRGSVAQWETVRRNEGALLRGVPLAEAERWLTERPDDLGAPERQFIQASRALRTRSVRRLRAAVAVLALLVMVASSLGGVALWQRNEATEQSKLAQSRALVTQANSLVDSQPDVAMLLAATAYKIAQTREAIDALTSMASRWQHADRLITTGLGGYPDIAFSPTDPTMVALADNDVIEVRDIERNVLHSRLDADGAHSLAFSPDGRILAYTQSTDQESKVVLWSPAEERLQEPKEIITPGEYADDLTFSPDGTLLGACVEQRIQGRAQQRRIQLWSAETLHLHRSVPLVHGAGCAFGFRDEGRELAYTHGDEIITQNIATGAATRKQPGPPRKRRPSPPSSSDAQFFFGDSSSFTVAPDGRSAIYQGQIHLEDQAGYTLSNGWWDFDRQNAQSIEPSRADHHVSFASDSRRVAISQYDSVILFDAVRRTPIAVYPKPPNALATLSSDGHTIAMADTGKSNAISLIDTDPHHGIPITADRVAIRPDSEHLTAVSSGKVAIYPIGNPKPIMEPADDWSSGSRVEDLSPDGLHYAFTDDRAHTVSLLDVSPQIVPEVPLKGNHSAVLRLSFDPRSELLACADKSEIIVWSTKTRATVSSIPIPPGYTTNQLAVSPGGRYVAAISTSGEARLWDTTSHDHTGVGLPFGDAQSISFSPDGTWLSIGGQNEIKLWILDAKRFDDRRIPVGGVLVRFSPDGSRLATRETAFGRISVWGWNMRDPLLVGTVSEGAGSQGADFAFASGNSQLAVGGAGVFVVPFDAPWALGHVCHIVGRDLTQEEWNKYLPGSDYVLTCTPRHK